MGEVTLTLPVKCGRIITMKTTFKTMTDTRKTIQKRKTFQDRTGLKWDYYHTGMGMRFTPVITKDTPMNDDDAENLLPYLTKNYQEFVKLAEDSGINLMSVLIGAKTLVKNMKAVGTVNRSGGFFAIRAKHKWEITVEI